MAKKTHDTQSIFDALNAQATQETQNPQPKQKGRPKLDQDEKKGGYRYNLNLDKDLKVYLKNKAWQDRMSATDYICKLLRADMEAYFATGGTTEGWIDIEQ